MARCTKEEALATRHRLIDAAECVFAKKGVSRTSLSDIATAAGVSRGAIYWHFKNKADLFNAMMERTTMPMEDALHQIGHDAGQDPLEELRRAILDAMQKIATDERTRRVFEVATLKVEYVDELLAVQERQQRVQAEVLQQTEFSLREGALRRSVRLPVSPAQAAQGFNALVVGLILNWLLAPQSGQLVTAAETAIDVYLRGLGLEPISLKAQTLPS